MGKAVYSAKDGFAKTNLQKLILQAVSNNTNLLDGQLKFTEDGGYVDRNLKIDAYLNDTSIQVKMDYRSMVNFTTAVEFTQFNLVTSDTQHGHFMDVPRGGGISERQLIDNVDFLYYILPGEGISIWKPAHLSRLVFHTMRAMPLDFNPQSIGFNGEPLRGKNCFKIAVAANKQTDKNGNIRYWNSINYLLPNEYLMSKEGIPLGHWETDFNTQEAIFHPNEDDTGNQSFIKPYQVIDWWDVKDAFRYDSCYGEIVEEVTSHIYQYKYGKRKALMIADCFDINPESITLYDWKTNN